MTPTPSYFVHTETAKIHLVEHASSTSVFLSGTTDGLCINVPVMVPELWIDLHVFTVLIQDHVHMRWVQVPEYRSARFSPAMLGTWTFTQFDAKPPCLREVAFLYPNQALLFASVFSSVPIEHDLHHHVLR